MIFNDFKNNLLDLISNSNVNLGRLHTKTRSSFLKQIEKQLDAFAKNVVITPIETSKNKKQKKIPDSDERILCVKPTNKSLNIGKGVHSMTPNESAKADEQLTGRLTTNDKNRVNNG